MLSAVTRARQGRNLKCLLIEQIPPHGVVDELCAIAGLELVEQMPDVGADRGPGELELRGDLRSGPAVGDLQEDLSLAGAEQRLVAGPAGADLARDRGLGVLAQRG